MVVKLRTARIRSPSRRAREASDPGGVEGSRTRTRSRTSRSRSPVREATARGRRGPRGQPVVVDQTTEEEPVQPVLDDASDSSVNPRLVAAAPGAPNLLELFGMEDQDRAERAVDELEQIEGVVEGEEVDPVRNTGRVFPRLPPTPAEVRTRSESRFDKNMYLFLVALLIYYSVNYLKRLKNQSTSLGYHNKLNENDVLYFKIPRVKQ